MVDYVEDPIGRIVNVHWADDDGSHPPDEPVLQCGTYSYSFRLDYISSGIVSPIPTGSDGDPWMVRDPSSPDWQHTWPLGLTLTTGAILFGRGQTRVQMTPASYTISTSFWDLTNSAGSDRTYGLLLIHSAGPRDYNQFPYLGIPTSPQPYEPFFIFTGGSLAWTYQINPGLNGEIWKPTITGWFSMYPILTAVGARPRQALSTGLAMNPCESWMWLTMLATARAYSRESRAASKRGMEVLRTWSQSSP